MPTSSTPDPASIAAPRGGSRRGRVLRVLAAVLLGLLGGWVGLTLGGTVHHEVGPLTTSMRVEPAWGGGSTVEIPPLGELHLDTHAGPLGVHAALQGIDVDEARGLVSHPDRLEHLEPRAAADLRAGLEMAALRALVAAALGAAVLSALALRRVRAAFLGAGTATVALVASASVAAATFNPAALTEPRYTGLLTSAPSVVGSAQSIVTDFGVYGDQLARLVQNVSGLYAATSDLPVLPPDGDLVRVLHVSDLHLAPQAWDVVEQVARQYHVDVVVDSGDITDHGTALENRYLRPIRSLDVPYVWVRGNHDSTVTQAAMRKIPNAVVLDGHVRRVAGLSFLGVGDPTFTPDKTEPLPNGDYVTQTAEQLAQVARDAGGVDVTVFHDPVAREAFDGVTGVALFGHRHYRKVWQGEAGTWEMMEGSTGGSGLRALEPKDGPAPIELSVLYLDRDSGDLRGYDDISLGGLGLASAKIDRHVVDDPDAGTELVAPRTGSARGRDHAP